MAVAVVMVPVAAVELQCLSALSTSQPRVCPAGSASPVTAVASYAVRKHEAVLTTGHASGEVRTHSLRMTPSGEGGSMGAPLQVRAGSAVMRYAVVRVHVVPPPESLPPPPACV